MTSGYLSEKQTTFSTFHSSYNGIEQQGVSDKNERHTVCIK